MGQVLALDAMLAARTLWHAGRRAVAAGGGEPSGHAELDARLPQGGWPRRALTELLLPSLPGHGPSPAAAEQGAGPPSPARRPVAAGMGELSLLLPALARLTAAGERVVLVAPPYIPYAPAWQAAGVDLALLEVVEADPRQALWAQEQCLRSGACGAVLGWPPGGDDRALRRLQVAADSGDSCGFVLRDRRHAANASPAALRLLAEDGGWRVLKCRGAQPPAGVLRLAH